VPLRLKSLRSAPISVRVRSTGMRLSRLDGRPIVLRRESRGLSAALPTVPRVAARGSRMPSTFSADRLEVLPVPIVLPIRELESTLRERWSGADRLSVIETDGSLLPIIPPMSRLRSVRCDDRSLLILDETEGQVELTAGCFAPVGAEELRVPIELPIRERWLVVGSFFAFEGDGVLRLLELPKREAPLERAAGCSALLGTDGLVVLIVLPIRDDMLGLILLLVFVLSEVEVLSIGSLTVLRVLVVGLFVIVVCERLLDGVLELIELPIRDDMLGLMRLLEFVLSEVEVVLRVLVVGLFVIVVCERLLDGVLVLIELPIRDDMLGLMRLLEFVLSEVEVVLRVLVAGLFVVVVCERLLDGVLELIELPIRDDMLELIRLLVLGAVGRELIDRLEMLVLGARLVMALLEVLVLGVRLVIAPLEMLLLGARLVMALLEMLLLGARLVMDLLEMLLLGALLVIDLLEMLLLGDLLVMDLLEVLLLGVRLVMDLLELLLGALLVILRLEVFLLGVRLAVTRLELELRLDVALGAGAGLEACRVCLLELLDLLLLDCFVAARTGS